MSRRHRANPIASLKAESIFGSPVLFSGMAALILTKSEIEVLSQHVKNTTENLLKLHRKTPASFVFLISGTWPAPAKLHMRQLTLFSMVCRLPRNILNRVASYLLLSEECKQSWFGQIEALCFQYDLPHPITLLESPLGKEEFKSLLKAKISDYWLQLYRREVSEVSSLKCLK